MTRIIVERFTDKLHRSQWMFGYNNSRHELVLDVYSDARRETARHKWRTERIYYRFGRDLRRRPSALVIADVPLPDDVIDEARAMFASTLKVTWEGQE